MAILLSIKGHNVGVKYELKGTTNIGRGDDNDICIPHPNVSRYHCVIEKRGHAFYIQDKNSINGVFVNGEKVEERLLQPQDKVQVGNTLFVFEPAFDLSNVVFDNKTICLLPPAGETVRMLTEEEIEGRKESQLSPAMELMEELAGLFSPETISLSDTLRNIVLYIAQLFQTDGCVLFLYDPAFGELRPMVGVGKIDCIPLSREAVRKAFDEKKTVYISAVHPPEGFVLPESIPWGEFTLICAPILLQRQEKRERREERGIGAFCLIRSANRGFSIHEVMRLRAIGRIVALPIEFAWNYDKLERKTTAVERSSVVEIKRPAEMKAGSIVFVHPSMERVLKTAEQVAEHSTTILLEGETGTGKELIARHIHSLSPRRDAPFMAINCAAIPETLFESELFGYERGAFTGADRLKHGRAEIAHGGTLFLDEVSELSPQVQPKLLRFLEEKAFYRVGGTRPIRVDVRIIAATNKELEEYVKEGKFRQDLFYRLSVVKISIPPLKERPADIKPLAEYFIRLFAKELGKEILGITDEALLMLEKYPWPGNVRELQNCIERAILICDSRVIEPRHILLSREQRAEASSQKPLAEIEKEHIRRVLEECGWNQLKAAEILGIHRNTLRQKILQYKIRETIDKRQD